MVLDNEYGTNSTLLVKKDKPVAPEDQNSENGD